MERHLYQKRKRETSSRFEELECVSPRLSDGRRKVGVRCEGERTVSHTSHRR